MKRSNMLFDIRVRGMKKDSQHHIIPKSRGGNSGERNIAKVNGKLHQNYHTLFENRTPEEIIDFLNDYFWSGKYEISITKK